MTPLAVGAERPTATRLVCAPISASVHVAWRRVNGEGGDEMEPNGSSNSHVFVKQART